MKNSLPRFSRLLPLTVVSIAAAIALNTSGCAIAAVGLATGYMGNQDKSEFHKLNLQREKAGLRPLSREEWKHQMNPGEVRRTKGDVAGLHHGGDVRQGESRPAHSKVPPKAD